MESLCVVHREKLWLRKTSVKVKGCSKCCSKRIRYPRVSTSRHKKAPSVSEGRFEFASIVRRLIYGWRTSRKRPRQMGLMACRWRFGKPVPFRPRPRSRPRFSKAIPRSSSRTRRIPCPYFAARRASTAAPVMPALSPSLDAIISTPLSVPACVAKAPLRPSANYALRRGVPGIAWSLAVLTMTLIISSASASIA